MTAGRPELQSDILSQKRNSVAEHTCDPFTHGVEEGEAVQVEVTGVQGQPGLRETVSRLEPRTPHVIIWGCCLVSSGSQEPAESDDRTASKVWPLGGRRDSYAVGSTCCSQRVPAATFYPPTPALSGFTWPAPSGLLIQLSGFPGGTPH